MGGEGRGGPVWGPGADQAGMGAEGRAGPGSRSGPGRHGSGGEGRSGVQEGRAGPGHAVQCGIPREGVSLV